MKEIEIKLNNPVLWIDPEAMKRIRYYTEAASGEVSGLGIIAIDGDKDAVVEKIYLLEQKSSAAETEIDGEAVSKLMMKMIEDGEDPSKLKFWWHSHAAMGVFWSGTDEECARTLGTEYSCSLVVNKSGDTLCRLDYYKPFRMTFDHINLRPLIEIDEDLKKECAEEVKDKVRPPVVQYHNYQNQNWNDHDDWGRGGVGFGYKNNLNNQDKPLKLDLGGKVLSDVLAFDDALDMFEVGNFGKSQDTAYNPLVWERFYLNQMKAIGNEKFKVDCQDDFGTWVDMGMCHECKASKECKAWSAIFSKREKQLDDAEDAEYIYSTRDKEATEETRGDSEMVPVPLG